MFGGHVRGHTSCNTTHKHVPAPIGSRGELFRAHATLEGPRRAIVKPHVTRQVRLLTEPFLAVIALETLLSGVNPHMTV